MKEQLRFLIMLPLVALFSLLPLSGRAQVPIGNFTYTFSGNEATITATSLTFGNIVFPETVLYNGRTYAVTAISYSRRFIKGNPTSITGKSIKSITGGANMMNFDLNDNALFSSSNDLEKIDFPVLEILENCMFLYRSRKLISVTLPALKEVKNAQLIPQSSSLKSIDMPLLENLKGRYCLSDLTALETLNLPSLKTIEGSNSIARLPLLKQLSCPSLQRIQSFHSLSYMPMLESLYLPELLSIEGYNVMEELTALKSVTWPKLQRVEGDWFMRTNTLNPINFPYGCEIKGVAPFCSPKGDSLIVTGVTKIDGNFIATWGWTTLKYISFPDVIYMSGGIGHYSEAVEEFDAPNLTTLENITFFNQSSSNALTKVNIPKLTTLKSANLFSGVSLTALTLSGALEADANSQINLDTYPTVVTIADATEVKANPTSLFGNVMGGRFIVPKGKAALFAKRWNLPLEKTMLYAPVSFSKTTSGTLYSSGSITEEDGAFTYGGTEYINQYDFSYAMSAAECTDALVLGPNDTGFVPSSTLTVSNYNNLLPNFEAYYGSVYTDALTPTGRLGTLTLAPYILSASGTVKGSKSTPESLHEGLGRAAKGFLFRGNSTTFSEVYLPYTATAVTTPASNFFEAGAGIAEQSRANGDYKFYWHDGTGAYQFGFYESNGVVVPKGRAYLSIPSSMLSNAKGFRVVFENSAVTNIANATIAVANENETTGKEWYTLQGIRLVTKPTQTGVYLHEGRKVIIR